MNIEQLNEIIDNLESFIDKKNKRKGLAAKNRNIKEFRRTFKELEGAGIERSDIKEKMSLAIGISQNNVNRRISTADFSKEHFELLKQLIIEIYNNVYADFIEKEKEAKKIEAERKVERENKYHVISNITEPWAYKYIYVFKSEETGRVKIGIANNPKIRIKDIEGAAGFKESQERAYFGPFFSARKIENSIHKNLKECNYAYEWFDIEFDKAVMAAHYGINKFFGIKAMMEYNKQQQLEREDE